MPVSSLDQFWKYGIARGQTRGPMLRRDRQQVVVNHDLSR
jgi:hypothetical protein